MNTKRGYYVILYSIAKALEAYHRTGLDSGTECAYNILKGKQFNKEDKNMDTLIEERMKACKNHPERKEMFLLESLLIESGKPYFFNFWEEIKPDPFNKDGGDIETDIDWDKCNFLIEIGAPVGFGLSEMSVCFNTQGDPKLLELLDMRPAADKQNPTADDGELHCGLTAEQAMEFIKDFFEQPK